jgi:hypothetical protein
MHWQGIGKVLKFDYVELAKERLGWLCWQPFLFNFSRNEICISQLIFLRLSLCISICVHHQFFATKILYIYASMALVFICLKKEYEKCPLTNHLFSTKFSCQSFANTNNPPRTHLQICISWF